MFRGMSKKEIINLEYDELVSLIKSLSSEEIMELS